MAQSLGNKAKGRQSSKNKAKRVALRQKRANRKAHRKVAREKRIFANKVAGKVKKHSPSDQRRAAARAKGLVSARIKINREERKASRTERALDKARALRTPAAAPAPSA